MEADSPDTAPAHDLEFDSTAPEFRVGALWMDADRADPDPGDRLAGIDDAIERLTQLDPAEAAAPGAAIADILSRALEEEER